MDGERFGLPASKRSRGLLNVHASSISDLPPEVLEIIFEKLNSVNRKKIERVCKRWMQIIRSGRKFRTHLLIEFPCYLFRGVFSYYSSEPSYDDWCGTLRQLVNPDLEVVHLKSLAGNEVKIGSGIHSIMRALKTAGVDLSRVDIIFSDCTIDCAVLAERSRLETIPVTKRIRIIRTNITVKDWFEYSTQYHEAFWLESLEKLPRQVAQLFLAEHGPLTRQLSNLLGRTKERITFNGEPDVERINRWAGDLSRMRRAYVDEFNWIEALMTIAQGGHVSKYTVEYLDEYLYG